MPSDGTLPFLLHMVVEIPASLNFLIRPGNQLAIPAPQAHVIIRQYATLLLSSNLIALVFFNRAVDETSRNVAGALALYHVTPIVRAVSRLIDGERAVPLLHASVHLACLASLTLLYLG